MTRTRRLGAVMLATPVAAGVMVVGLTGPAQAATGITAPAAETITEGSTVTVSARADNVLNAALQIAAPGSDDFETIASGGNLLGTTSLSKTIGIARNGVYKVRLTGGLTGATFDSRNFTVRVPPATPDDLRTSVAGRKVVARWKRGLESDLKGYRVAATGIRARTGSAEDMCGNTECMTTITLPAGSSGQVPVFVKALRSDGAGGTVGSRVATSKVDLAGTPATGGLPTGSVGLPGLPPEAPLNPLQVNAPITLPSVTPDGATPGFQYPAPVPEVAPAQPAAAAGNASAVTPLQWGKSVAIALILLVIAAHLGTWTRRVRVAEARGGGGRGASPDGTAGGAAAGGTPGEAPVKAAGSPLVSASAAQRAKTDSALVKDSHAVPAEETDVSPGKEIDVAEAGAMGADTAPVKKSDVSPGKEADVSPVKGTDVSPGKEADVPPAKGIDVPAANAADVPPAKERGVPSPLPGAGERPTSHRATTKAPSRRSSTSGYRGRRRAR